MDIQPETRKAYTISHMCKVYSTSRSKIYEQIKQGKLKVTKLGRKTLIDVQDAEAWFESLKTVEK